MAVALRITPLSGIQLSSAELEPEVWEQLGWYFLLNEETERSMAFGYVRHKESGEIVALLKPRAFGGGLMPAVRWPKSLWETDGSVPRMVAYWEKMTAEELVMVVIDHQPR